MIDVSDRIWTKEQKESWEKLIEKMEKYQETLKPCPFCGQEPILDDDQEETGEFSGIKCVRNYFEIRCRTCGFHKQDIHKEEGLNRLVEWWNTRAEDYDATFYSVLCNNRASAWKIGGEIYAWNDDKTKLVKTILKKIDTNKRLFITESGNFRNAEPVDKTKGE